MDARIRVSRAALVVAVATLAGSGRPALAYDAQLFAPAVDPTGYFSVYGSQTGPAGRFHIGTWFNTADDPIVDKQTVVINPGLPPLINPTLDEIEVKPVTELHTIDVTASYSLLDFLEIGVDIPVTKVNSEVSGVEEGIGLDDILIVGKLRLLEASPIGIALVPFVDVPTGDEDRLTSNEEIDFGGRAVVDFVTDEFRASLNGGVRINDKPFKGADEDPDDFFFGAGAGLRLLRDAKMLGGWLDDGEILAETFGHTIEDNEFEDTETTPLEIAGGIRIWTDFGPYLTLGVSGSPWAADTAAKIRGIAAIAYTPAPPPPPPPPPPAPPPPPPPPEKVVVTDEELITLEPIYFDFDKATIKPVSHSILDQVAQVMTTKPDIRVRIESHTDWMGSDAYNQALSERRAASTKKYLLDKGIDPARLESEGFGESRPIATNETDEGRARNRRSEFHIIK